jgi:hypothetical protein
VVRPLVEALAAMLATSTDLVQLWGTFGPTIRAWFGL